MNYGNIGLVASSPMGDVNEAKKESQVERSIINLQGSTENLGQMISRLESRLTPVLSPEVPQGTTGSEKGVTKVGLASVVDSQTDLVARSTSRINSIIRRLEI